ncbi:MAG: helix-turn-helix domain-containing protein [Nitrospiraceae bacterium]|nr:helix-turn-helix domain-containing protein [Nitrospiraceae bacterium]
MELFTCSFNISKSEYLVLKNLLRCNREKTIVEISTSLKKERSTVQKSIQTLMKRGLVRRRQLNLDRGGYKYYYSTIDKKELKEKMHKIVDSWVKGVKNSIDEF